MINNDVSLFSFDQETSFITYIKVPLISPQIQAISNQLKSELNARSFFMINTQINFCIQMVKLSL